MEKMWKKNKKLILILALLVAFGAFFAWTASDSSESNQTNQKELETEPADFADYEGTEELETVTLEAGDGEEAKVGDFLFVHYEGYLTDGTKFDSSYDRGQPLTIQLAENQLIQGWVEGVPGMQVGERRRLVIPPELAYGEEDQGPIPGNSVLIFDIELLGVSEGNEGSN